MVPVPVPIGTSDAALKGAPSHLPIGVPVVPHYSDLPKKFVRSRRRRLSRPTFPLFQASPHRSEGDRCKDEQDADDVHDRR